jgi:hypothetical protein
MSETRKDAPRRYIVDDAGQRILVGLTVEETLEFEKLDIPAALGNCGRRVIWNARDVAAERPEPRWLELYTKHARAWSAWMAESRGRSYMDRLGCSIEG